MARPQIPCPVPRCKGHVERAKHPSGATLEWCPTCERRLLQLEALQEKLRALDATPRTAPTRTGAPRDISDEELLALVKARCRTVKTLAKELKRGVNFVVGALRGGKIPSAALGRMHVIPLQSARAYSESFTRGQPLRDAGLQIIAALPRSEREALRADDVAKRAKRSRRSVSVWLANQRKRPELRRVPTLAANGRAVLTYWWQEVANG